MQKTLSNSKRFALAVAVSALAFTASPAFAKTVNDFYATIQLADAGCTKEFGTEERTPLFSEIAQGGIGGSAFAIDTYQGRSDCMKVGIYPAQTISAGDKIEITNDFRVCIVVRNDESKKKCTPWVTENGGWSTWSYSGDTSGDTVINKAKIYIEKGATLVSAVPGKRLVVSNIQLGVQLSDNACTEQYGTKKYTPLLSANGGLTTGASDSSWYDPDCARVSLAAVQVNPDYPSCSIWASPSQIVLDTEEYANLYWTCQDGDGPVTVTDDNANFADLSSPYYDSEARTVRPRQDTTFTADYPGSPCISKSATVYVYAPMQCDDGVDNDADGLSDMDDPGCDAYDDNDEYNVAPPNPECSDTEDNDADGFIDYPEDPGCESSDDQSEYNIFPACSDGVDNDGDDLIDLDDDGCTDASDDDEYLPPAPACSDGVDNDDDGLVDMDDPGCQNPSDTNEFNSIPECRDGIDNDNDNLIDYPEDRGCQSTEDNLEEDIVECNDGLDNDNDGLVDMDDPGCNDPDREPGQPEVPTQPACAISVTPSSIIKGVGKSVLKWACEGGATNATINVSDDNSAFTDIGEVPGDRGQRNVSPTKSTTFKVTYDGVEETATLKVTGSNLIEI